MTATLSDDIKGLIRLALRSHDHCVHDEVGLCYLLISAEVEFRQGDQLDLEQFAAVGAYIADCILESLILKGMVEPVAVDETGGLVFGVTETGADAQTRFTQGRDNHDR